MSATIRCSSAVFFFAVFFGDFGLASAGLSKLVFQIITCLSFPPEMIWSPFTEKLTRIDYFTNYDVIITCVDVFFMTMKCKNEMTFHDIQNFECTIGRTAD